LLLLNDFKCRFRAAKVRNRAEDAKTLRQEKRFLPQKEKSAGKNLSVSRILLILQVRKKGMPALQ